MVVGGVVGEELLLDRSGGCKADLLELMAHVLVNYRELIPRH